MPSLKNLTPEERAARLKQQRLEASRRFYDAHRRKKVEEVKIVYPPGTPVSYTVDYIREYQKNYYQANRAKLLERANQRYRDLKAKSASAEKKE